MEHELVFDQGLVLKFAGILQDITSDVYDDKIFEDLVPVMQAHHTSDQFLEQAMVT